MPQKHAELIPLGFVELSNGKKAIYPMNDIFLNFTFQNPAHWEALRLAINILIHDFNKQNPDIEVKPITGKIEVRTQFKHLLDTDGKKTKDQDIRLTEDNIAATYLEFQNRAWSDIPLEIRSVQYFGLGISNNKGHLANQIWLLAADVESVLQGNTYARYVLKDQITGRPHPNESGIKYISLPKLSKQDSPAGELALFLLGKEATPKDKDVKKITEAFNTSFDTFKADKEAVQMLSFLDREKAYERAEGRAEGRTEGRAEGRTEGRAEVMARLAELIEAGTSPQEAMRIIMSEDYTLTEDANSAV